MPLFIRDREVGQMADRLAALNRTSKTEAVRQALSAALVHASAKPSRVEQALAIGQRLRASSTGGQPADKAFIDSLYEDD